MLYFCSLNEHTVTNCNTGNKNRPKGFKMKKQNFALATALLTLSTTTYADKSAWNKFIDDSTLDMDVRVIAASMSPSNVAVNNSFTPETATNFLFTSGMIGSTPLAGMSSAQVQAYLSSNRGVLDSLSNEINTSLTKAVKKNGEVKQSGTSYWFEFESGYLGDIFGFDLGYQGTTQFFNKADGVFLIEGDDTQHNRLSTARAKIKIGDEKRHVSIKYGRGRNERLHFGREQELYFFDKMYGGLELSLKRDDLDVYALSFDEYGHFKRSAKVKKAKDYQHHKKANFKRINSVGFEYTPEYGELKFANTWTKDYMNTSSIEVSTGIPLSYLGADIPNDKLMDYLLVFQVNYDWQDAKKDFVNEYGKALPNHDSTNYEIMIGAQLDNALFAVSLAQNGKNGFYETGMQSGDRTSSLRDEALINNFNAPNQKVITFVTSYNGKNIGLPGLDLSAIVFHSTDIDMERVLESGNVGYYLTGQSQFTESLFEARYKIQEGKLEGLSFRVISGYESNRANVMGLAGWIEYSKRLF